MDALDRRLRAIYDALDARNYKSALKLCIAAGEKHPKNDLIKTLQALALARSGKAAEAGKICDDVLAQPTLDDNILHPMRLVLKELGRGADNVRMYEAAFQQNPHNTDLLEGLFSAYARERQYLKQQQTAMKLSKAAGTMLSPTSQRYQWWTIVSIMLQARQALAEQRSRAGPGATQQPAAGALDPGKLMQLAESMAARIASKEQKLESFECLILWLDLLLALGKTSDALALVSGPLAAGVASQAEELSAMKADLLAAEGQLEAAAQVVRSRLESNPDDWAATLAYFDCLLPETAGPGGMRTSSLLWFTGGLAALSKPADGGTDSQSTSKAGLRREEEAVHASLHQCQSLVDELLGKVGSLADVRKAASAPADGGTAAPRLTMRGPHLAKVELAYRRVRLAQVYGSDAEESQQALASAALTYFTDAGHLTSCAADLRSYTAALDVKHRAWLGSQLQGQEDTLAGSTAQASGAELAPVIRKVVCALQIMADMSLPELHTEAEAVTHAANLLEWYHTAHPLYKGLDSRERGPADELPLLVAAALVRAAALASSERAATQLLASAVLILEAAVQERPYHSGMHLAAAALHTVLGCPEACHTHVRALDIKHIQLDSVAGHMLLPALVAYTATMDGSTPQLNTGSGSSLQRLLREVTTLFTDHFKDAGDTIAMGFTNGNYSQVLGFAAFWDRLFYSHTRATARSEQVLAELRQAAAQCNPSQLASSVASVLSDQLSRIPATEQPGSMALQFNGDLGTRPPWYPPHPDSCGPLQPLAWWSHYKEAASQGAGHCWFISPDAADSAQQLAQAFRQGASSTVSARWALPHAVAQVLSVTGHISSDSSSMTSAAAVQLVAVSASAPEDPAKLTTWLSQQATAGSQQEAEVASQHLLTGLSVCNAACLAATSSIAAAVSAAQPDMSEAKQRCEAAMTLMRGIVAGIVQLYSTDSSSQGGVLLTPGSALSATNYFLGEVAAWHAACLQALSGYIKAQRTKVKKSKAAGSEEETSLTEAQDLVSRMMSDMSDLLTQLHATLSEALAALKSTDKSEASQALGVVDKLVTKRFDAWKAITAAKAKAMLDEQTKLVTAQVQRCSMLQQVVKLQGV